MDGFVANNGGRAQSVGLPGREALVASCTIQSLTLVLQCQNWLT